VETPELARAAKEFRPSVGIMLRRHTEGKPWQMPQGGIDEGEEPGMAATRELKEEVGTDKAEILAENKRWLFYDLPAELTGTARHEGWRGQRQKWVVMGFKGCDADINIWTDDPEFSDWKWVGIEHFPTLLFRSSERSI
jgi:putative (di)nucleoside polyphosphate hydrolase